jgi:hypothetical protein
MRSFLIIWSLAGLLCQCHCFADSTEHLQPSQKVYEQFRSIKTFTFGGVGPLGSMSDEEQCFRAVATSSNALQLFMTTLTNGTTEARIYALCGIRILAPHTFDLQAAPAVAENKRVTIMEGCFLSHERASNVVVRIKEGFYDRHLDLREPVAERGRDAATQ